MSVDELIEYVDWDGLRASYKASREKFLELLGKYQEQREICDMIFDELDPYRKTCRSLQEFFDSMDIKEFQEDSYSVSSLRDIQIRQS